MKNTKKLIAVACTVAIMTGMLSGCSKSTDPAASKAVGKDVVVDIFQFKVEAKDALEKATKEYMALNKNVKINVQTVGGGEDYGAALKSKFASGQEPTIYNIGGTQDVLDWKAKLQDLSSEPWVSQAYPGTLDAVKMDGKLYGMPFNQEGSGLIYNKTIFTKAGIDASKIKTYADLKAASKTLDSKKKELKIDAVFALPGKETWVTGLHLSNVAFANEFPTVVDAFNAKEITFKQNEPLKKLLDLQIKYAYKPDGTNKSINSVDYSTQVEKMFSMSKVAIIQQGNWAFGSIDGIDPELSKNIGILPMPLDGVKEGCIQVGVPMYWAINSSKDDGAKKAAADFLNWLYTSDRGKEMIIKDFKFIPAFKGYDGEKLQPTDALGKEVLRYVNEGKTIPWVFMGYPTAWGMEKFGTDVQKYIAGTITWDKLVDNMKTTWSAARKK
ncbi:ABC transporter substrate-binding protein [Clostridium sp. CM028]|uniref:ABC transporter substrate-binding protein n=1 Tax=unclassified Clostridium TaxID=2614128 RepID=UPI001C0D629A|nr:MULTISPECIES: ABC transporter substrate-binding protein [unclassified Clostridium]MBU3092646.1 ABC transporter substrate-binding protein [Clostridium sp. CF011]MBW9145312.1 ABC transporter substrate-binding protein [Clostridium sp. CM027]MBW9148874.1 ABC transporter substrate-binding protein [Clostridium sp. CM028]UVE42451.1 ABC transporter substrate-binding protein [Clostridium sp. CM027]WAG71470.1 ABC transporter substrate-binding protein [Clostridium sp. CF011]